MTIIITSQISHLQTPAHCGVRHMYLVETHVFGGHTPMSVTEECGTFPKSKVKTVRDSKKNFSIFLIANTTLACIHPPPTHTHTEKTVIFVTLTKTYEYHRHCYLCLLYHWFQSFLPHVKLTMDQVWKQ